MRKITILSTLVSSIVLVSLLTACGEDKPKEQATKKEQRTAAVTKAASTDATPQIEVVASENIKEIKVKEKTTDKAQSKSYYYDYNIKSEYDEHSRPANVDAAVRAKPRTAIDANMNIRSPYEEVQLSLLVGKLSKEFIVKCSACHSDYANGVIGPSLLGKNSNEIFDAIAAFKSGEKTNVLMDDLIKMMSEDEIRKLADEIYTFNEKIKEARK
ncbi:c-type cytochrome [Sulfurovum sp. CS9]|uniref:c-type cytochrome n=1 Tax=Sulfurovum sp. CS9 TaxID=3391146 RepID=UPI0039EB3AC8